jgi:hypothetical protein
MEEEREGEAENESWTLRANAEEYPENRAIHQTVPDHRVKLTPEGWRQVYFLLILKKKSFNSWEKGASTYHCRCLQTSFEK